MYETLKRLWSQGRIAEAQLDVAIAKGWITADQKAKIMAQTI